MSKISIQNLAKAYGGRDLFRDFSLEITGGMRLAVVGRNGAGKSTFIKLLAGVSSPDAGRILFSPGARVGYVAQELDAEDLDRPLLAWVLDALPSWHDFWAEWDAAAKAGDEKALARLATRQAELEHSLGYSPEHAAKAVLSGLGFTEPQFAAPIATLSGGWRERAKLARVLTAGADVLLLDEPTNHLDLEAVEWLESYLMAFTGVLVFVAHDRVFLDRVATHTVFFGEARPILRPGSFSEFLVWREEMERQWDREAAAAESRIKKHMAYIDRFRYKSSKARQAQSKLKNVARLEKEMAELENDRPGHQPRSLDFSLPDPERGDKTVLSAADLEYAYPGGRPLWPRLTFHLYRGQKIALVGPNGAGKTTLLKIVTGELKPDAGRARLGANIKMGYYSQHQTEILSPSATVLSEMRRLAGPKATNQEVCNILGLFLIGEDYWERPVASLSGGEKSRLLLGGLFAARANFLVLDEPTNHLDLESREALVRALGDYAGAILLVAHDRHLLREVASEVWVVGHDGLTTFPGGFEDYERATRESASERDAFKAAPKLSRQEEKDRKRRQAELRNAAHRELKPKKAMLVKLETELEIILNRQHDVETQMADPETYAKADLFCQLNVEYHALVEKSENLLQRMEKLETEIASLEAKHLELGEAP